VAGTWGSISRHSDKNLHQDFFSEAEEVYHHPPALFFSETLGHKRSTILPDSLDHQARLGCRPQEARYFGGFNLDGGVIGMKIGAGGTTIIYASHTSPHQSDENVCFSPAMFLICDFPNPIAHGLQLEQDLTDQSSLPSDQTNESPSNSGAGNIETEDSEFSVAGTTFYTSHVFLYHVVERLGRFRLASACVFL
jgi:hypothetical protein